MCNRGLLNIEQLRHHCIALIERGCYRNRGRIFSARLKKKAGVFEDLRVLENAGLLVDGPPSIAGLPFV